MCLTHYKENMNTFIISSTPPPPSDMWSCDHLANPHSPPCDQVWSFGLLPPSHLSDLEILEQPLINQTQYMLQVVLNNIIDDGGKFHLLQGIYNLYIISNLNCIYIKLRIKYLFFIMSKCPNKLVVLGPFSDYMFL